VVSKKVSVELNVGEVIEKDQKENHKNTKGFCTQIYSTWL
jgi:hypothetical protein